LDWISKPIVGIPLRIVRRGVDRMLTWSSVQGAYAVERIGFDEDQITFIEHPVDQNFFAPVQQTRSIIFSAGETQRDFPTLIAAVSGLEVPLVIAASRIGVYNGFRTRLDEARELVLPPGGRVQAMDPIALRSAYASAKIVVVPLIPAQNNAGISVLLEAMAMGRPVIITRTEGQVDVVRDGENGLYVPAGDPDALRTAIRRLLADPDYAERLGRAGRAGVLEKHRAEEFAAAVRNAAYATVSEGGRVFAD
jgi:glycosyltransferase involved in cell wall biosynthesis